ncbi:cell division protein FtsX [Lentiprolixibacter aurantiacus]|uniref:Cell division protein FtsX n=1 Tax=Lentiprolixibacter aurantiacus TaxID=2993939 RepID=A0AAE3SMA0_9FLAO|nr:permease-like cell division protein FtsX [Lentiprolixibacter aurantiacus]MCX2718230.1 permease-like cell division protein FtsX [Lentiprolixibacter aurantiacus]
MSKSFDRFQRRKLITSYFSVTLSISLVLFLLGILGLLVLNTQKLADHFKEQITVTVFLKDAAKQVEIDQLEKRLAMAEYTKSTRFVSKEEAAELHSTEIGENFIDFLGYNPLRNSIDLQLNATFVDSEQIATIAEELSTLSYVEEVSYDQPLIALLTENVKRVSLWILVASAAFTLIAVLLINSSIRLSIYSKRFIIKTMQMVGATKRFIRRPFIWTNIKLGMFGAIIAVGGLAIVLYYFDQYFPELNLTQDILMLGILFASVFALGIVISLISTFFATQRFLNLRTDDLYY